MIKGTAVVQVTLLRIPHILLNPNASDAVNKHGGKTSLTKSSSS